MRALLLSLLFSTMGLAGCGCGDDDDDATGDGDADADVDGDADADVDGDADADVDGDADADVDGDADADADADGDADIFRMDSLHVIELTVAEADLPALESDQEARVPCDFVFDGEPLTNVGVRLKGGLGSFRDLSGKAAFSLKFNQFVAGQHFHGLSRLVLNNMVQDPGMVAEHLGYEMFRQIGIPAAQTSYATVSLNGDAFGVYLVKEVINNDFTESRFGDSSGNLYDANCCGDIMDGVLELKNNGELAGDTSDLTALIGVVEDSPADTYVADLDALLDTDWFLKVWALEGITRHWDGYNWNLNNYYLYHRPSDGRFIFIPHGLDQIIQETSWNVWRPTAGRISRRLLEVPAVQDAYDAAIRDILANHWDVAAYQARVDEAAALIADAVAVDPRMEVTPEEQQGWVEFIREWIEVRPGIVMGILDAVCGDGAGDTYEECDDGGVLAGDGCNPVCLEEYCGDGVVQAALGEVCDGIGCRPDCSSVGACGDGTLDFGETCDDSNLIDGDGCSATCDMGECEAVGLRTGDYAFCFVDMDWVNGLARCALEGGTLAVANSQNEHDAIVEAMFDREGHDWFIGANDRANEGVWTDPAGTPLVFQPWSWGGRPNGLLEANCAVMDIGRGGDWTDTRCLETHPVICEL